MTGDLNPYQSPGVAMDYPSPDTTSWKWLFFSFDGRITRGEYWKAYLISVAATVLVVTPFAFTASMMDAPWLVGVVALLACLPLVWASLAIHVKRWHDRGKSGAWVLISLIPYIGSIWSLIECGCLRGTYGDNQYGPDRLV